jgi:hypothetical protein
MQYILTEQEYKDLQENDKRFNKLTMIVHNILEQNIVDRFKFNLIVELHDNLAYASQDGSTDSMLHTWEKKEY